MIRGTGRARRTAAPRDTGARYIQSAFSPQEEPLRRPTPSAAFVALAACGVLVGACRKQAVASESDPAATTRVPSEAPSQGEPQAAVPTPEDLYAACERRVEEPQDAGECSTDEDCGTGGASQEVCTTTAAVADLVTTAERRMCFTILDSCGCHEGRCTWTLKDALPAGTSLPQRPGMLPPTGGLPQSGGMLPPTGAPESDDGDE